MVDQQGTAEFLSRLSVTPAANGTFAGTCIPAWPGRAFGGQLAAQSLQAAFAFDPNEDFIPWSLHVHFLAPTRANEPIEYEVVPIKNGRTLSSRQVFIRQDGKQRVTALALFGTTRPGPEHQYGRPPALSPIDVPAEERLVHPTIVPVDADFEALGYPTTQSRPPPHCATCPTSPLVRRH